MILILAVITLDVWYGPFKIMKYRHLLNNIIPQGHFI